MSDPTKGIKNLLMAKFKEINKYRIIAATLIGTILFSAIISLYIYNKATLNKTNCENLKYVYDGKSANLKSISADILNNNNPDLSGNLRDYYIKSAYNCCSAGEFKNDWVNLCALENCFQQGVRCLDFEIYSIDNQPVIATSATDDYTVKETYNYISLEAVLAKIIEYNTEIHDCPNSNDPLFLHFRIKSDNCKMYKHFAQLLEDNRAELSFMSVKYNNEYNGENFGNIKLSDLYDKSSNTLKGNIVIMVDNSNPIFKKTDLVQYVNISTGSIFAKVLRYNNIAFTQDMNLAETNKRELCVALPDISPYNNNFNFNVPREYGCQFIAMSFQNYDSQLEVCNLFFEDAGYAFALKPENLRFIPTTIPPPKDQNVEYSYKTRPIKSDYYSYDI